MSAWFLDSELSTCSLNKLKNIDKENFTNYQQFIKFIKKFTHQNFMLCSTSFYKDN